LLHLPGRLLFGPPKAVSFTASTRLVPSASPHGASAPAPKPSWQLSAALTAVIDVFHILGGPELEAGSRYGLKVLPVEGMTASLALLALLL